MAHAIDCYSFWTQSTYDSQSTVEAETKAMERQNICYWWFYICGFDISPRNDYHGPAHMSGKASDNWVKWWTTTPEKFYINWLQGDY